MERNIRSCNRIYNEVFTLFMIFSVLLGAVLCMRTHMRHANVSVLMLCVKNLVKYC
jgi:hypothetical protein